MKNSQKQNCIITVLVSMRRPGCKTEMVKVELAPTDLETAKARYRKLTPVVFEAGTQFDTPVERAQHVVDNIKDVLAKHGKQVTGIVH